MQIYSVNDLMNAAAEALLSQDISALEGMKSTVHDWLQPEYERNAQLAMLNAMLESIESSSY